MPGPRQRQSRYPVRRYWDSARRQRGDHWHWPVPTQTVTVSVTVTVTVCDWGWHWQWLLCEWQWPDWPSPSLPEPRRVTSQLLSQSVARPRVWWVWSHEIRSDSHKMVQKYIVELYTKAVIQRCDKIFDSVLFITWLQSRKHRKARSAAEHPCCCSGIMIVSWAAYLLPKLETFIFCEFSRRVVTIGLNYLGL